MRHSKVLLFKNLETLSQAAADGFALLAKQAIDRNGEFITALTGGRTVVRLYEILSSSRNKDRVDWSKVIFYWGDERMVPKDDPESNFALARELMLDEVGVDPGNVFRIRGELPLDEAVEDYRQKLKLRAQSDEDWPRFDLVLLGMGSDGHVASIFPGAISEEERTSSVVGVKADYQGRPSERVSLTPSVFNSAKDIFFLVAGESKSATVAKVLSGRRDPVKLPVHRIRPTVGNITWFLDQAAASKLSREFIDQEVNHHNHLKNT